MTGTVTNRALGRRPIAQGNRRWRGEFRGFSPAFAIFGVLWREARKVTGFLEIDRQDQKYQPAGDRIRGISRSSRSRESSDGSRQQAARCMDCGIPYCHGPTGCPVHNQIPDWNDLVYRAIGKRRSATCTRPTTSPSSPAASARPRARKPARSTSKTFRSRSRRSSRQSPTRPGKWAGSCRRPPTKTGKKVAIIGSGPAGMAAAQQLARAGHDGACLRAREPSGGLLRYGIPDFKMEKHFIDRRVEQMEGRGRDLPLQRQCRRRQIARS
jgi:glutamate synthase (NADPH/NADH) small chain